MGKSGSELCFFFKKGLKYKKYPNLKMLSDNPIIFSLRLPRKTKKLDPAYEQILKDWRARKGLPYNYSKSKQAMEANLRTSDFLQKLNSDTEEIICRMLVEEEIIAKKSRKYENIKKEGNPTSVGSSGYESGCEEDGEVEEDDVFLTEEPTVAAQSPEQSHLSRPSCHSNENYPFIDPNAILIDSRNPIQPRNPIQLHFEKMFQDYLNFESLNLFNPQEDFHDIEVTSSDNTFEDLMKINIQSLDMESPQTYRDEELASSENSGFLNEEVHRFEMHQDNFSIQTY